MGGSEARVPVTSYCVALTGCNVVSWNKRNNAGFVWQRVMQPINVNVNRIESHHSSSEHFPDVTNKGRHSLSMFHKKTTRVIQSFLLADADRY